MALSVLEPILYSPVSSTKEDTSTCRGRVTSPFWVPPSGSDLGAPSCLGRNVNDRFVECFEIMCRPKTELQRRALLSSHVSTMKESFWEPTPGLARGSMFQTERATR